METDDLWKQKIAQWVLSMRENDLSEADRIALNTMLRENPDARRHLARIILDDTALGDYLRMDRVENLYTDSADTGIHANQNVITPDAGFSPKARWWRHPLAYAAAAMLVVGLGILWFTGLHRDAANTGPIVARVAENSGAQLTTASGRSVALNDQMPVRSGPALFHLRAGFLKLAFLRGATTLIEAPASFEVRSDSLLVLHSGALSAVVSPEGIGFSVLTPSMTVEDLGTEFGVSACASSSEVHVFKGEVLVKASLTPEPQHLLENNASRVDSASGTPSGIEFTPQRFIRTLAEPLEDHISAVHRLKPVAYYRMRIMPDGKTLKDVRNGERGLDGTIVRGENPNPWAPGKYGAALKLGGPEERTYARIPGFPLAASELTVCAWVLADSRPRWATIAKHWAKDANRNYGGQFHFGLWNDDGALEVHVHDGSLQEVGVRDAEPLPLGTWHFVAFTVDGSTLRLYRNGAEVASAPCAGLIDFGPPALGIGVKLDAAGQSPEPRTSGFWSGRLDEVAIFHRALVAPEIAELFRLSLSSKTP